MAIPNIDNLTTDELRALLSLASSRLEQAARDDEAAEEQLRVGLTQVAGQLDTLIGPDSPTAPALTSLTEVRLFSQAQMAANSGLAHELAFQAIELVARATRDIARIAGR